MTKPPSSRYNVGRETMGELVPPAATVTVRVDIAVAPAVSVTVSVVVKLFAD